MTAESSMRSTARAETRIVVLPPTRADGIAMGKLFAIHEIEFEIVANMAALCAELDAGAGSLILSEEAVLADSAELIKSVSRQPVWSDLPIIVLSRSGSEASALAPLIQGLGNVSLVERPVRTSTLVSLVKSGHRARARQYQVREYLGRQQRLESEREQLLASERTARSEAERSSRMKDEFLATLSHELRTPLNAMLGWTQVLRKSAGLPEDALKGLTVIERNARAQAQIIGDLLDMSSIISGKVRLQVQQIDLAAIVNTTVETVRPGAEAKGLRLQVVMDSPAAPVRGDPNRLQQVFWNLLTNAVKFTHKDGLVRVTSARVDSHVTIEVTDTGEGIDPTFLPHVFDRFRQADSSSARQHGGLGIGLSIVKQLVELHGGTIRAASNGRGTGATFCVCLPLMSTTADAPTRQAPALAQLSSAELEVHGVAEGTLRGITVLIVDDQADSRALIQRVLEDYDARTIAAASAEDAIAELTGTRPDLLVSDIGMPGQDGYALMRRIRSMGGPAATTPAIALTAYARTEDRVKAIQAGYQLHLAKPVEAVELVTMIKSLVGRAPG